MNENYDGFFEWCYFYQSKCLGDGMDLMKETFTEYTIEQCNTKKAQ
jgi:hypothetical protein